MQLKLCHIALTLCYLMAWLLPLVHELEVEVERAEHRQCIAEYSRHDDADTANLHRKCRHHHHDDAHCAICQSGLSVSQGVVLPQKPVLLMPQAKPAVIRQRNVFHVCQRLWHAIEPRAP